MRINPRYLIYHDLIGLKVLVKEKNRKAMSYSNVGIVIDDTKNMLMTQNNNRIKKIIKKDHMFVFEIEPQSKDEKTVFVEVDGIKIVGPPLNRLRSLKKKKRLRS